MRRSDFSDPLRLRQPPILAIFELFPQSSGALNRTLESVAVNAFHPHMQSALGDTPNAKRYDTALHSEPGFRYRDSQGESP